jgi:glycosyltransferase involved in cell wall biosynthesis
MALLDVLVPHYNDPQGLVATLASVRAQTWQGSMRVVVVDDGSSNDVRQTLGNIIEHSGLDIVLLQNKENRGRPYTRNVLLDSMESPYASWIDSGDEWYPTKIQEQLDTISSLECSRPELPYVVTCNYHWHRIGHQLRPMIQRTGNDQIRQLLTGHLRAYLWTIVASSKHLRTVGWFDERLTRLQDLDFLLRFVCHQGTIEPCRADAPLCIYHKSDLGRGANEIRQCSELIFQKHCVLYNRYGEKFKRRRQYYMELLSMRYAYNNGDAALGRAYGWRAFRVWPFGFVRRIVRNWRVI